MMGERQGERESERDSTFLYLPQFPFPSLASDLLRHSKVQAEGPLKAICFATPTPRPTPPHPFLNFEQPTTTQVGEGTGISLPSSSSALPPAWKFKAGLPTEEHKKGGGKGGEGECELSRHVMVHPSYYQEEEEGSANTCSWRGGKGEEKEDCSCKKNVWKEGKRLDEHKKCS